MRVHKAIHDPLSPNHKSIVTDCCVSRVSAQPKRTHPCARGAHSSSSRSRAAGSEGLLADDLMGLTPHDPLCTHVDLSQDVA